MKHSRKSVYHWPMVDLGGLHNVFITLLTSCIYSREKEEMTNFDNQFKYTKKSGLIEDLFTVNMVLQNWLSFTDENSKSCKTRTKTITQHYQSLYDANFFWSWVVFLFSHPTSLLSSSQLKEMHLILILLIFSVFSRLYKMHLSVAGVRHKEQQRNKDTDTQTHKDRGSTDWTRETNNMIYSHRTYYI